MSWAPSASLHSPTLPMMIGSARWGSVACAIGSPVESELLALGGVSERFNVGVLKTPVRKHRGFESLPLRHRPRHSRQMSATEVNHGQPGADRRTRSAVDLPPGSLGGRSGPILSGHRWSDARFLVPSG